jgi:hypothetical protein
MTIERNNPGNIEKDIRWTWQGEMPGQKAGDKLVFDTLENGSRAMIKDLLTKVNSGVDTINEIITKYAPPSENPTAKYIAYVSQKTGIPATQTVSPALVSLTDIAYWMSRFEHGINTDDGTLRNAFNTAHTMVENEKKKSWQR